MLSFDFLTKLRLAHFDEGQLVVAPIVMESLLKATPIFSWFAKATAGSSWQTLEKKALVKKLGMESGRKLLKKRN